MFEFFRKHTRLLQFILVVLIFPSFVFLGVQGYDSSQGGSTNAVASVAGRKITQAEWDAAHRTQIERVQRQMPGADVKMFDTPEMKAQTLDALVRERVMLTAVDKLNLVTNDERLQRQFVTDPQLAFLRNPDGSVNKDALAAQGMSSEMFAQRLRQDLSMRQVLAGLGDTAFAPASAASAALDAMFQQREIQVQRFEPKDYLSKVAPTDADIEKYYKDPVNAAQFQAPEQATVEYVMLDIVSLKKDIKVSEDELKKYYTENQKRFTAPEERRASHILIKAEKGAPAAEREKAKAKAEALLAQWKAKSAAFADLARNNSDDPGSADKGGDLDFFGRGAMVKPFEDAAFSLKPGETSGVVESDFGYHIIQVTGARGGESRPFEAVRAEIEDENRRQQAQAMFSEQAVAFSNLVEDQSDSLKPAVDKFKLELKTAQGVKRTPTPGATGPLANPKFLEALFAGDVIRNKRNTLAVDIGSNQLVAGRVLQHSPAQQLPLTEVSAKVRERVVAAQAAALARQDGEARLAALQKAPDATLSAAPVTISRAQSRELPRPLIDAALKAPATPLPAFVGVDLADQGYAIAKVTKVLGRDPVAGDPVRSKAQYVQAWSDAESQAYYVALKSRFKAEVKVAAAASGATQ
ncbi:MAG: peptidylprolyl isomerase [Methylibium sp. NZG]|nr:MAG: peptidylprolyl isomerase [Methylibium sp. NZG]